MARNIIVANRLRDGAVVYLTQDGDWSTRILDSRIATDDGEAVTIQNLAQLAVGDRIVVDPTMIEVAESGSPPRPVRLREEIRAAGPTVRLDLCRS